MTETMWIEITLPPDFDGQTAEEQRQFFQDACSESGEFQQALDLECDPPERLAKVSRVAILHVEVSAGWIRVEYRVDLEKFRACVDTVDSWTFNRATKGIRQGVLCCFPRPTSAPERSTADEL
jgi:hypothetical protein